MPILMLLALSLPAQAASAPTPAEEAVDYGFVEFTKDPKLFAGHSIKIFAVLEEKNRLLYIDELGSTGLRSVTVKAPVGERQFMVVVQPTGAGISQGAPSEPVRRNRPNVTVKVASDMTTLVTVGGFTDFVRAPAQGDLSGTKFVSSSNDPEASQFRTRITVGKPTKRR